MRSTYPLVPAIVITARPHQYERAVKLGIDGLMEKPLELPLLLETIRNLLAESESQRVSRISRCDFKTARLVGPAEILPLRNTA
jgi:DNA-binding response OmpR family regulator